MSEFIGKPRVLKMVSANPQEAERQRKELVNEYPRCHFNSREYEMHRGTVELDIHVLGGRFGLELEIPADVEGGSEAEVMELYRMDSNANVTSYGIGHPKPSTAKPDVPQFVACKHPLFGKENYGECLGQCALAGEKYGGKPLVDEPFGYL